ncbi:MAG: response regulator transcription factor [Clostridia bacterium]|nr:response regulator transcription factor [Clostridia bacterium]
MSYRIRICDDCPEDLRLLQDLVENWAEQRGVSILPEIFPSAEAFLFRYGEDRRCDILLLDVEMQALDGIRLAKQLRADGCGAQIIFVTSHGEFWDAGYEVDALHYLTKPVDGEKLRRILDRAAEKLAAEPPSLTIAAEGETFRLFKKDILYAEASLHYISIHTTDGVYRVKESISAFADRLGEGFFRIHRGVVASLSHITRISRTSVYIGKTELPLSRGNYDAVNRAYINWN